MLSHSIIGVHVYKSMAVHLIPCEYCPITPMTLTSPMVWNKVASTLTFLTMARIEPHESMMHMHVSVARNERAPITDLAQV